MYQAGLLDVEKYAFCQFFNTKETYPADHCISIMGDFNGHVGEKTGANMCHAGKGFGAHNAGHQLIADFAETFNCLCQYT